MLACYKASRGAIVGNSLGINPGGVSSLPAEHERVETRSNLGERTGRGGVKFIMPNPIWDSRYNHVPLALRKRSKGQAC
jgi:hypothetical protein